VMAKERQNFVYGNEADGVPGCVSRGIREEIANKIFDEMTDFAKYAFNKSHAAAYAVVAFQTAYLKCHYPVEFMAALMSSVKENSGKVTAYIQTLRTMGIKLLPPDINLGRGDFSVSGSSIRYGLSAVKSVGDGVTDVIRHEVEANGPFKDLEDFVKRLSNKEANKRTIESFILSGAFDGFGANRRQMMQVYGKILEQETQEKKNAMSGQMSLLDFLGEEEKSNFAVQYPDVEEYKKDELLAKEKEMLGVYLSGHPMDDYMDIIEKQVNVKSSDFSMEDEDEGVGVFDRQQCSIAGSIEAVAIKTTRRGDNMAFITLEDLYGTVEVVVFPRDYTRYRGYLAKDSKVMVTGNASVSESEAKLLLSEIMSLDEVRSDIEDEKRDVWLRFDDEAAYNKASEDVVGYIEENKGKSNVIIFLEAEKKMKSLGNMKVRSNEAGMAKMRMAFGEENVRIVSKNK
ncbi:MAG: OB-fold nucleic acid binding domain-containing protein, partial [Ruminococcus sp.]|nr:OB-fold nucleic acid binding domain-containing protein [Ruminococcus sp.]